MSTPPRLLYGFLSQSTQSFNLKIPWVVSNRDGAFAMNYEKHEATRDNLIAWANTNWGERPMNFKFGLDARRYLFEERSLARRAILENARDQLSKYFKELQVQRLDVLTSEQDPSVNENSIIFILEGIINNDNNKQVKLTVKIGT